MPKKPFSFLSPSSFSPNRPSIISFGPTRRLSLSPFLSVWRRAGERVGGGGAGVEMELRPGGWSYRLRPLLWMTRDDADCDIDAG